VDVSRTIKCALLGDALVLGSMLEEHGAQVRQADEDAPMTMVATGTLEGIRAAVAQLRHELVGAGPVVIEGEDRVYGPVNSEGSQCKFPAVPGDALCSNHAEAMLHETGPAARGVTPGSAERAGGTQAEAVGSGPATGALYAHACDDPDQLLDVEVVIIPEEARYHRAGCTLIRLLSSHDLETLTRREARTQGYVPCRACKPERADPDQLLDFEVVIIPADARYHRAGCTLIRLLSSHDLEALTRREAQTEGYVPCVACQPDIPFWAQPKRYPAVTTRPATSPRGWRLALRKPFTRKYR
jgi:hypothetical protein